MNAPLRHRYLPRGPDCPRCRFPLNTVRHRDGLFYSCPSCDGRAVTVPQLRRMAGDRFATSTLRQINRTFQFTENPCPFCSSPMRRFECAEPVMSLEACKQCDVVWFDSDQFKAVPEGAAESPEAARMRAAEAFGAHKIEVMKQQEDPNEPPDEDWKTLPAFFGFPVESESNELTRRPWFTWTLAAVIAAVSISSFFDFERIIKHFGMIPSQATRLGGLTLITSFFLHGGFMHLVGNLYFLLIFGDNVEDFIGRWRYAMLLLASTITGDLVHILVESKSNDPCIGASGGIAGVIVFYALQFPRARLSFLFFYYFKFHWFVIPAWVALVFWLLMQSVGVLLQIGGFSNVAATAHLGGAGVGFVLWLCWRRKVEKPLLSVS